VYGVRAACCGLWSWNGKPLVDGETHVARIRAHAAFDPLWKNGLFKRGEGYRRLARAMGLTQEQCHISTMDRRNALRVVDIVRSGRLAIDPDAPA
jgi:hypothetical protein